MTETSTPPSAGSTPSTQARPSGLSAYDSTWRTEPGEPAVPASLRPPRSGRPAARLQAWQRRHAIRERRAFAFAAGARRPVGGLPVASRAAVFAFLGRLLRARPSRVVMLVLLHAFAAVAGLVVPRVLGLLVDRAASEGTTRAVIDGLAVAVAGVVLAQTALNFLARRASVTFGEELLAESREEIVDTVLGLPLGRVEEASSGDLVTRVTRDVSAMSQAARTGFPEAVTAGMTVLLTAAAMIVNSPLLTVPLLVSSPLVVVAVRRYLRRSGPGYLTEGGTYSRINSTLTETVEGARTVEALGLQSVRRDQADADIEESAQAERYTMALRNLLFAQLDFAFGIPLVLVLLIGAWGYSRGIVSLGEITAATLYVGAIVAPMQNFIHNLDRLQSGLASTSRLLGIAEVEQDRSPGAERPSGTLLRGRDLRYAYREGVDVLHGIDLDLRAGERLAVVGPSGSGKSTLSRLLSGVHPPRTGSVTVGGVELTALPLDVLRTEVALVTQEHHVFVGTVRDNVVLAREDAPDSVVEAALRTVDAWEWVERLGDGLDTVLGSGHLASTPAQAQQIALARLVVADPHTLVLDEATSLIEPRAARHVEGSMAALLADRTVVAIAHRLHTAHDADRIAVVIDGRIAELGSHHELVAREGEYARLWRAWTS